ncbi:unnamed protein product [Colias eurytheme]|nr:unnamed protein product [Colias eurytheme]
MQDNESKARCRYCARELSRGGKNASIKGFTTTALWTHVKRFQEKELHVCINTVNETSTEVEVTPAKKQASLKEIWEKRTTYENDDPRAVKITYLIAEQVCLDMEPLNLVNKKGYRRLLSELVPRYNIISRTHLTEKILPDINERVKIKLKEQLTKTPYLSVTTDMWTSDASSQVNDFISLTGHGVNEDFQLKSYCLEVFPFEGDSHSGENIANNMHMMFLEWQLVGKVAAVVTDNIRNMVKANDELDLGLKHISCLVRDVETRWDSTYQMLKRLHEQRIAIQDVLPSLPNCRHEITARQWAFMSHLIDTLANFEEATKELSKESMTLSQAIPIVRSLKSFPQ